MSTSITQTGTGIVSRTTTRYTNSQGQTVRIVDAENGTTNFVFDPHGNLTKAIGPTGIAEQMTYDLRGRKLTLANPDSGTWSYEYNGAGELVRQTDAKGQVTRSFFDALGRTVERREHPGSEATSIVGATNLARNYDGFGRVSDIAAGVGGNPVSLSNAHYTFDALGNLTQRSESVLNPATQSFGYDQVDRLTSYAGQSANYDAAGNLQTRGGTSYSYQAGSHRMTSAGSTGYGYDANGNVTSISGGTTRTVTPTAFNLPATIVQGATSLAYVYDGAHKRIKETSATAAGTTTTWYLGSYEEITRTDGITERRHWIQTPDGPAGIYTSRSDGTTAPRYWLTDHLGSVVGEVDQTGTLKQSASFGAWGDRAQVLQADPRAEDRGFTGHEHLTEVNLVHMNGRVYDPVTGRFLAADPLIQDPYDAQSYNRYSYVKNNPLSFTDPSGYSWWTKWRKPIAAIAVAWALGPGSYSMLSMLEITQAGVVGLATGSAGALTSAASAAAAGFAAGGIQGGNMQSAVTGAVVASLSFGIGEATQHGFTLAEMGSEKFVANVAGHAALGCAQQSLAGGNCGAGAAAAGFSAVAGPLAQPTGLGVIAHAAIGAVASKLAGGKAEDGAVTAAFAYLFNEVGSAYQRGYESRIEVLTLEPVGWGGSSFGHSAITVNGMTYSFGPDGMTSEPAGKYLERNSFRSAVGNQIAVTNSQAADLRAFLSDFHDEYSVMRFSTCVQPVVYALTSVGINIGAPVFPVSLGNAVLDSGRVTQSTFYSQTTPRSRPWYYPSDNAPWAR